MARKKLPGFALLASVSDSVDPVDGASSVSLFYGVPNPAQSRSRVVLFWEAQNVPKLRVTAPGFDTGVLVCDPLGGSVTLDPGPAVTTTYTLMALDAKGETLIQAGALVSANVTIAVR